jgi:hypothetical protein
MNIYLNQVPLKFLSDGERALLQAYKGPLIFLDYDTGQWRRLHPSRKVKDQHHSMVLRAFIANVPWEVIGDQLKYISMEKGRFKGWEERPHWSHRDECWSPGFGRKKGLRLPYLKLIDESGGFCKMALFNRYGILEAE